MRCAYWGLWSIYLKKKIVWGSLQVTNVEGVRSLSILYILWMINNTFAWNLNIPWRWSFGTPHFLIFVIIYNIISIEVEIEQVIKISNFSLLVGSLPWYNELYELGSEIYCTSLLPGVLDSYWHVYALVHIFFYFSLG